jgi:hypothetical protein
MLRYFYSNGCDPFLYGSSWICECDSTPSRWQSMSFLLSGLDIFEEWGLFDDDVKERNQDQFTTSAGDRRTRVDCRC